MSAGQIGTSLASILSGKRGKLLNVEQKGLMLIIQGEIPASETFDLSEVMRGGTAGKAMWNTYFKIMATGSTINLQIIGHRRKKEKGFKSRTTIPMMNL